MIKFVSFSVWSMLTFFVELIWSLCNLYLFLFQMVAKGGLFVLILVALVMRTSTPIKRGCSPTGHREFEPLMMFREAEDTGLLWMYALHSLPRQKKLTNCEILLKTRSLILILLLTGSTESHPGEFLLILFLLFKPCCLG